MKIYVVGINGFIGSHFVDHVLEHHPDWEIHGIDVRKHRIAHRLGHLSLHFVQGDFTEHAERVSAQIAGCDVVLPLAAIATPKTYVDAPLRVFELDFEANLWIVRQCVKHRKRLIFPSTSEVYGMCTDASFHEDNSNLVLGPVRKSRWIYSCCKQLLDRVITAYGDEGLEYTIFRPFNWIGKNQDEIQGGSRSPRVITQFIGNLLRCEPIRLVNGGTQKRAFLDVKDGIRGLTRIIESRDATRGQIFNIGFPDNEYSIAEVAWLLIQKMQQRLPDCGICADDMVRIVNEAEHYGAGYQDVTRRVPSIHKVQSMLSWHPEIRLEQSLDDILAFHLADTAPVSAMQLG